MKDVRVSVCEKGRILGATFKGWMDGEEERREREREREWERKRDKDTEWQNGGKKVRECTCLRERERERNSGRMIAYGLDLSCTRASFVPSVDQARKNWTEKESERERQRWDRQ